MSRLLRSLNKAIAAGKLEQAVQNLPRDKAWELRKELAERVANDEKLNHHEWEIYEHLEDRFVN